MEIKIFYDAGINIYSKKEEVVDTEELGFSEEQWINADEGDKSEAIRQYWMDICPPDFWYEDS